MVADYVPYVNAVDSRWSSYGSDSASSARYAERYGLSLYVFCSLLMFKILNTVKTNKKLLIDFKIKIMGFLSNVKSWKTYLKMSGSQALPICLAQACDLE